MVDLINTIYALFEHGFGEDEIIDAVEMVAKEIRALEDTQESQPVDNAFGFDEDN